MLLTSSAWLMLWAGLVVLLATYVLTSHALPNQFGKALILRDYWFCWVRKLVVHSDALFLRKCIDPQRRL